MADPDYSKLNQIKYWTTHPDSPLLKVDLPKYMAPFEQQVAAGKLSQDLAHAKGAQFALDWIAKQLGGAIPDMKAAQDNYYASSAQRIMQEPGFSGTPEDAAATARQSTGGPAPYSEAYNLINMLKNMTQPKQQEPKPQTAVMPVVQKTVPKPKPKVKPAARPAPATEEGKIGDSYLQLLEQIGSDPRTYQDLKER